MTQVGAELAKTKIGETFVLAAIPGVAYWLAYLYELGYCLFFDIPPSFIDVSITNVLTAAASVLGFLLAIQVYLDPMQIAIRKLIPKGLRQPAIFVGLCALAIFGVATVLRLKLKVAFIVLGGVVALIAIVWVVTSFHLGWKVIKKQKEGLSQGDAAAAISREIEEADKNATVTDMIANQVGRTAMRWGALFIALSGLCVVAGARSAQNMTRFMVPKGTDAKVVLKKNGNQMLLARFDRQTKVIFNDFTLLTSDDKSPFLFTYEKIGPLEPMSAP
jgi:hypothetical protein